MNALTVEDYIKLEDTLGATTYKPLDLVIERAEGVWVYDIEGNKYLDCLSAYSSVNQGHCHPEIVEALKKQADKLTQVSRAFRNVELPLFFKELIEFAGINCVLPMNTGAEAVETAIKLARKWAYTVKGIENGKAEIIVCENNFHGRTTTVISFSSEPAYKDNFTPLTPGFKIIPYGDIEALKNAITPNTCAFLVEPIQGEGGVVIPPEGYIKEAQKICKQNNVLLMLDEIQTGLGRTGKQFAFQHEDAVPDVLIIGKSLSGGVYPVSAVLADKSIMGVFKPGEHGSTFAGNPLACAVARAAMKVLLEENLAENSAKMGAYLLEKLQNIKNLHIKQVRGRGLFIGIVLDEPARPYCEKLQQLGILCKETRSTVIRISPPLIITKDQVDFIYERMAQVF
ncbi:MAG: ornithine--oxo-acid transaminase [Candidatus Melainabacteria bacterium GWF2_37_15]|nr:MAG: ornithine--oxo-acid transaminase [Candidatus Melainabacteria bacterium GWF2_37_15]